MSLKRKSPRVRTRMKFTVGASIYTLTITPGPLVSGGSEFVGYSLQDSREILISGESATTDRLRILLRQLAYSWTFETGKPIDNDGWCDLSATICRAAMIELAAQGGEAALMAMRPKLAAAEREPKIDKPPVDDQKPSTWPSKRFALVMKAVKQASGLAFLKANPEYQAFYLARTPVVEKNPAIAQHALTSIASLVKEMDERVARRSAADAGSEGRRAA